MIFDQGFLPLAIDKPISNCKAAVLVLVRPEYFISSVPAISGEHCPSATRGGARWKTSNSSRGERKFLIEKFNAYTGQAGPFVCCDHAEFVDLYLPLLNVLVLLLLRILISLKHA
jgi:hypothetical protein